VKYLKSFVLGSSGPVFLPFFYGVTQLPEKKFEFESYMFRAPLYFGVTNVLRLLLKHQFNLSDWTSFLIMSQLSPAFVSTWITLRDAYDFPDKARWYKQYALLWAAHGFTWLVTIRQLEKVFSKEGINALTDSRAS